MLMIPAGSKPVMLDAVPIVRADAHAVLVSGISSYGTETEYVEKDGVLLAIIDSEPGEVSCDVAALRSALGALPAYVIAKQAKEESAALNAQVYQAADVAGLKPDVLRHLELELGPVARDFVAWIISRTGAKS